MKFMTCIILLRCCGHRKYSAQLISFLDYTYQIYRETLQSCDIYCCPLSNCYENIVFVCPSQLFSCGFVISQSLTNSPLCTPFLHTHCHLNLVKYNATCLPHLAMNSTQYKQLEVSVDGQTAHDQVKKNLDDSESDRTRENIPYVAYTDGDDRNECRDGAQESSCCLWCSRISMLLTGDRSCPDSSGPPSTFYDILCGCGLFHCNPKEDARNSGRYRLNGMIFLGIAILDWTDMILDFGLVEKLRFLGHSSHASWLGVGASILLILHICTRLVFASSWGIRTADESLLSTQLFIHCSAEIVMCLLGDTATIYAFADIPFLYNPQSKADVANMYVTLVTGTLCAAPLAIAGSCLCSCCILTMCVVQDKDGRKEMDETFEKYWYVAISGTALGIVYPWNIYIAVKYILPGRVIDDSGEGKTLAGLFYFAFSVGCLSLIGFIVGVSILMVTKPGQGKKSSNTKAKK
eukprot:m.1168775 g.1168775  ORF g.1168775 m.1168775 type:complete len:463 (-) comp24508_c0_seq75:2148-3536(-)